MNSIWQIISCKACANLKKRQTANTDGKSENRCHSSMDIIQSPQRGRPRYTGGAINSVICGEILDPHKKRFKMDQSVQCNTGISNVTRGQQTATQCQTQSVGMPTRCNTGLQGQKTEGRSAIDGCIVVPVNAMDSATQGVEFPRTPVLLIGLGRDA